MRDEKTRTKQGRRVDFEMKRILITGANSYIVHPENGVAKANLICDIFGHKNTQEGVTAITNKVLEESPRCLEEFFTITNCSRCD